MSGTRRFSSTIAHVYVILLLILLAVREHLDVVRPHGSVTRGGAIFRGESAHDVEGKKKTHDIAHCLRWHEIPFKETILL